MRAVLASGSDPCACVRSMLVPLQLAWLTGCKLMHVGPSRVTPLAPACTESLHHSSRRSALALLAVATAVLPPLVIAEAATAAEGIAGRNDRMVVPILGDLMGLAGPGAHAMHIRCAYDDAHTMHTQSQLQACRYHLTVVTVSPTQVAR